MKESENNQNQNSSRKKSKKGFDLKLELSDLNKKFHIDKLQVMK